MAIPSIGILGGGQLAMMLAEAAEGLGMRISALKEGWNDPDTLKAWLQHFDIVTFENEFIDTELLQVHAPAHLHFAPSLKSISLVQDKLTQKEFLFKLGLPTPPFHGVTNKQDCLNFAREHGWPIVLKERRNGYDGRGTYILKTPEALEGFWEESPQSRAPRHLLVERFVPFATELAVQVARTSGGEVVHFPVVETFQSNGICLWVKAPAVISEEDKTAIQAIATTIMEQLNVIGVFAMELFYTSEGEIFINELAPRVHNSGHYTIEGCSTSQFAQHLLAVADEPLGATTLLHPGVAMLNILGDFDGPCMVKGKERMELEHPAVLHWYNKTDSRRGRKMGHITAWGPNPDLALAAAIDARKDLVVCPKS